MFETFPVCGSTGKVNKVQGLRVHISIWWQSSVQNHTRLRMNRVLGVTESSIWSLLSHDPMAPAQRRQGGVTHECVCPGAKRPELEPSPTSCQLCDLEQETHSCPALASSHVRWGQWQCLPRRIDWDDVKCLAHNCGLINSSYYCTVSVQTLHGLWSAQVHWQRGCTPVKLSSPPCLDWKSKLISHGPALQYSYS